MARAIQLTMQCQTAAVGERAVLGNYTLCGSGSAPKIDVDVKQSKGAITLSATPSKVTIIVVLLSSAASLLFPLLCVRGKLVFPLRSRREMRGFERLFRRYLVWCLSKHINTVVVR